MREGHSKTGNIEQLSTGYLKLANGTTAERPTAANGMVRQNTTTGYTEVYMHGAWHNMPRLEGSEYKVANTTGSNLLYSKNTDGKFLSVAFSEVDFIHPNAYDDSWVYIDPQITNSQAGYISDFYGTITLMNSFTDRGVAKTISLYINDTEHQNMIVMPSTLDYATSYTSGPISIDFNPGDKIRTRVRSGSNFSLGSIYVKVYFSLRIP